jgi:hypothetical protein
MKTDRHWVSGGRQFQLACDRAALEFANRYRASSARIGGRAALQELIISLN